MTKSEIAVSFFKQGFNCAQALLAVYSAEFNLEQETALKIGSPIGGGMGRRGETCGAVAGAFMIIGLKYGMSRPDDKKAKDRTYDLVENFMDKFKAHNNSIVCRELLGCDIKSPGATRIAKDKGPKYIQDAVKILEEIT
ncbi:MAG: C_GCAxxG_C_C family protein [Nitrospirae bacterium]|nr:C_GCAxxG_C_C family protein [Nitrospirota bacterium]